jgi:hypothetical protein
MMICAAAPTSGASCVRGAFLMQRRTKLKLSYANTFEDVTKVGENLFLEKKTEWSIFMG